METQNTTKYNSPVDYLKVFFRRKWLFIIPVALGTVAGIMACFLLPPVWESSTIILVEEEKVINPLFQNLAVSTTAIQRMQNIKEIILGWNSLVELTKKLDLAKEVKSQAGFEKLILGLRRDITVQMRQDNIIRIAYLGKEPRETQVVAKSLTDILVEKNMQSQTKETDVAINFIKEQLAIYKRKIKESEVAKLNDQLKILLQDSTEQHPLVRELRQKILIAQKELESGDYQVGESEGPITDTARKALKEELDKLIKDETSVASSGAETPSFIAKTQNNANNSIYKLLLMDKVDSSLARDINVNENIYNMLLQRLETAKITQRLGTSREGTRYTVLDPPRLPLYPVKPQKMLVIIMGLFLGAACGASLIVSAEFMDRSFLDIEDAKNNLSLPILGAISRITTQEQIAREKAKTVTLAVSGAFLAAVLVIATALFHFFKR